MLLLYAEGNEADYRGKITVALVGRPEDVVVTVTDNGIGLPQDRERIAEPYVTTREKGTGLGLAIVKKIVEEPPTRHPWRRLASHPPGAGRHRACGPALR